ncbi:MAG TPA: PAS domain-containing protein [Thermoanaerobaculaceae bacterium]|nr:PAS domain-containing protein [Thermoanaerobaculaceae bacterium]HPS77362.1 PAS domain-containing protein [Thermoanaerobaculaceae bacterium]
MTAAALLFVLTLALILAAAVAAVRLAAPGAARGPYLIVTAGTLTLAALPLLLLTEIEAVHFRLETRELVAVAVTAVAGALLLGGRLLLRPALHRAQVSSDTARAFADQLADSERRSRLLVERLPQAFVMLVDGVIVFSNRAFAKLLGVPMAEVMGKTLVEFIDPSHRHLLHDPDTGINKSPTWGSVRAEVKLLGSGREEQWVEVRRQVMEWESGPADIAFIDDVTERRRSRETIDREQRLFAQGPVVLLRWTGWDEPVTYVSANVSQLGYSDDDLLATHAVFASTFVHPDDAARVRTVMEEALATGAQRWEQEHRLVRRDGGVRWVLDVTVVGRDTSGSVLHFDGYLLDITDRKGAEEALRASDERYQLAIKAAQEVMYDWDVMADTVLWNQNTLPVLGLVPQEMGTNRQAWLARIHPADLVQVRSAIDENLATRTTTLAEYRLRRHDGSFAILLDRGLVVRDTAGAPVRVVGAMTDLTERKKLEEQLRLAQKIEALGQLAGGIAHDFNNLLTAIMTSCELLGRRQSIDQGSTVELETILRTANRAADLTRGLLAFARRQVLEPIDLDLNAMIRTELSILRRLIPETIRIDHILGHHLGTVQVDPTQIQQVLVNLCVNASDAMPNGGIITIETENVLVNGAFVAAHPWAKQGRYVLLSLTDTGQGMSQETLSRIFEPFFTTKEPGHGTGMGLATVYGVVQQHEGLIHVYSEVGKGTTFKVYLPVVERPAMEIGSKIETPVTGGSEHILVVEDETEVRSVLVQVLSGLGYRARAACDGAEALERLDAEPVDLIISDIVMPRMGGHELWERVRTTHPEILFLFSSGYAESAAQDHFVRKEGIPFIAKPYGIDVLARRVREVLDGAVT